MITVLYGLIQENILHFPVKMVQYIIVENWCYTGFNVSDLISIEKLSHDNGDGLESVSEHLKQIMPEKQNTSIRFINI
jgi:hypothetical protein